MKQPASTASLNPVNCLCARTRRAARQLSLLYEEALRPAALSPAQFELLGELQAHPARTQTELADHLALDQTTLSRNLRLLIARGTLVVSPSSTDRRKITYNLTPAGKRTWHHALPLWQAAQRHTEQHLASHLATTLRTLDRLAQATAHAP